MACNFHFEGDSCVWFGNLSTASYFGRRHLKKLYGKPVDYKKRKKNFIIVVIVNSNATGLTIRSHQLGCRFAYPFLALTNSFVNTL